MVNNNVYKLSPGRMSFSAEKSIAGVVPEKAEAKFFAASPQAAEVNIMPKSSLAVRLQKVAPAFRAEYARLIDPNISKRISEIRPPTEGIPREQLTVPISPMEQVNDEELFEEAANSSKKLYLSRYRIATDDVSGKIQYRVSIEEKDRGWNLAIYLEKYPAPKIEIQSREAKEIDKTVAVILKYQLKGSSGVEKELFFQEVSNEPLGLRAVLHTATLGERDELFRALTKIDYHTILIIRRVIRVAIPVYVPVNPRNPPGETFTPVNPRRPPFETLPPVSPRPHPLETLPPVKPKIPLVVDIADRQFRRSTPFVARMADKPDVAVKAAAFRTFQQRATLTATPIVASETPLFREVTRSLDNILDPFIFEPELHGYIFKGIQPSGEESTGLIRFQVGSFNYYQEMARRHIFYYLPDSFKIARRPESPHTPMMSIQFPKQDEAVLKYFALPYVDPDRLEAAANKLKDVTPEIEFQPLILSPDKIQFELKLPASQDPAKQMTLISPRSGIAGELHLTMEEFQMVFDAIFGGPENLFFQGQIKIEVFKDQIEMIDFIARMNDTTGDLIDYKEVQDGAGAKATFKNAIESPLKINKLDAYLQSGSITSKAEVGGLNLPLLLNPGEEVQFDVKPSTPSTPQGDVHAIFNMEGVQVLPDQNAIWDSIIEDLASEPQAIEVKTYIFQSPEASKDIMSLWVNFKTGESVELTSQKDTVNVTLNLPIKDRILRLANTGAYSYQITVIHKDTTEYTGPWKTDTKKILIINKEDWDVSAGPT